MTNKGNKTYRAIVGIHFDVDDEDLIDAGLEGPILATCFGKIC
jgi:hypothetical protein